MQVEWKTWPQSGFCEEQTFSPFLNSSKQMAQFWDAEDDSFTSSTLLIGVRITELLDVPLACCRHHHMSEYRIIRLSIEFVYIDAVLLLHYHTNLCFQKILYVVTSIFLGHDPHQVDRSLRWGFWNTRNIFSSGWPSGPRSCRDIVCIRSTTRKRHQKM